MKKHQTRALDLFSAMEALPDGMVLDAERALLEAEAGIAVPVKPQSGFKRFLNSGWGAAVISGIVALGVLVFIIRAGKEPPTYKPPVKPAGSTIEMSTEGADYTLSMEQASYDEGANRVTVVMTGKRKGESISMYNAWHLERLTENGAEVVHISFTEEVLLSAKPDRNDYATIQKSINIEEPLTAGHYRLHATEYDGEKYVSVAYCTFTVGDPGDLTWGEAETQPELDFPPAEERPYTVTTPDSIEYGATGLPITVKAAEPGVDLMPHRKYSIIKLAGPANGAGADWLQSLEAVLVRPDEQNGGYAVYNDGLTLLSPENWLPGLYRLYALNHNGEYVDYCDFTIRANETDLPYSVTMERVLYTEADTRLAILFQAHEPGRPISRGDCWTLWRVEDGKRTYMGSQSAEYALEGAEIAPDEYAVEHFRPSVSLVTGGKYKTLPAGQYELVFNDGYGVNLSFEVVAASESALTTADPGQMVVQGTFLWANGVAMIQLSTYGEIYPVILNVMWDGGDIRDLALCSGDTVEAVMGSAIDETFPCRGELYAIRKISTGTLADVPMALKEALAGMGYTVTDTPEG